MCIRDRDMIGHDPHELAAYLSAVLQGYTRQSAQAELERVFDAQYEPVSYTHLDVYKRQLLYESVGCFVKQARLPRRKGKLLSPF